jgi:GR25 family glycosyltransferase involved in LPS biosynthesis
MKNPFDYFEKICCINLPERKDRWDCAQKTFESYEIANVERVDGTIISEKQIPFLARRERAQMGCALSFYKVFKYAYLNKFKNILIFEDDFSFYLPKEETFNILLKSLSCLPDNWDIFYLGANIMYDYSYNPMEAYNSNLFKVNSAYCTHATVFSQSAISKIIKDFPNETVFINAILKDFPAIDIYIARDFCPNNLCFIPNKMICYQAPFFSNIEDQISDFKENLQWRFENVSKSFL